MTSQQTHRHGRQAQERLAVPTLRRRLRQRRSRTAAVLVLSLAVIVAAVLLIPRTDVTITVWYNEGLLNAINVDTKISNDGTTTLTGVTVHIQVFNASDKLIAEQSFEANESVPMFRSLPVPNLGFQGDQRQEYRLLVEVTFLSNGHSHVSSRTYHSQEPVLNSYFTAKVTALDL